MWAMALQIEDGNVSQAEQALRQAQDALRQALERGASDEELKKLMDNLRAAMDKFLQALAEEMRKNPQQLSRPLDRNTKTLSQQDLKSMMDRLEQMARSGNKDAAKQLLDQLQSMLENLQTARPGAQGEEGDDDMNVGARRTRRHDPQAAAIARQDLQGRSGHAARPPAQSARPGQAAIRRSAPGPAGPEGPAQQAARAVAPARPRQSASRARRAKARRVRKGQGEGEMGELGGAGEAMGEAEGELGEGDADGAVDSQGRALEAMRKGAQGLAQQMQQQGMGQGPGQPGRNGRQRAEQNTDPLGRPMRGREYGDDVTVKVPGEIDAQRARRILEELRKRFGESCAAAARTRLHRAAAEGFLISD